MKKETEEKIGQLQVLEQSMQNLLMQKQQFQMQFIETDSALNELKTAKTVYKIVGNIMVGADKATLEKELTKKKEVIDLRIKSFEKQEKEMKEKATSMQADVMKELKKEKK